MVERIQKINICLGITVLILAALACGSVQVGVVVPTLEGSMQPISDDQEPASELAALEDVDSQTEDEPAPEPATATPQDSIPTMAYLGPDNNVWVLEAGGETQRQVTFDANLIGSDSAVVEYAFPRLSSDDILLAYHMEVGTPSANGYDFTSGMCVENLTTGGQRQILDGRSAGFG